MAVGRDRMQRTAGRGVVEGLADRPGARQLLRDLLQILPRHVETDAVAEYVIERIGRVDVLAAAVQRHDHLALVAKRARHRRIRESVPIVGHGIARLDEEERRSLVRVVAAFDRVGPVVAAETVDAPNRKPLAGTCNFHRNDTRRVDDVLRGLPLRSCRNAGRRGQGGTSGQKPAPARIIRIFHDQASFLPHANQSGLQKMIVAIPSDR